MAKELPYFQFEPAEYLTKDISFCSLSAQGLFINICSYYWQRECKITKTQILRRFNYLDLLEELITENVLTVIGEDIKINFLYEQYYHILDDKKESSHKGKIGNLKRWNRPAYDKYISGEISLEDALIMPKLSPPDTLAIAKTSHIREDKRREEKIIDIDSSKLLSLFNSILGKQTRIINTKTKTQIKDRLKEGYTKEDIVNAIRNASKDPHHIDSNYKYLTLEFITKPDKLDRFVNMGDFKIKTQIL
jgi:uncharacterized phage protein (TIGR02220 family)